MTWLLLAVAIVGCGLLSAGLVVAYEQVWVRVRRRRVQAVYEQETAKYVDRLVPEQRAGDTPAWHAFIPTQRDGDDGDR